MKKEICLKKVNKGADKIVLSLLVLSMIFLSGIKEQIVGAAGNISNSSYGKYYNGDGGDICCKKRQKLDYTSVYARNDNKSEKINHWVSVAYATSKTTETVFGYTNVTYGASFYTVNYGQYKYIFNTVKETADKKGNKNPYCYLVITPSQQKKFQIKGVWSPDSV